MVELRYGHGIRRATGVVQCIMLGRTHSEVLALATWWERLQLISGIPLRRLPGDNITLLLLYFPGGECETSSDIVHKSHYSSLLLILALGKSAGRFTFLCTTGFHCVLLFSLKLCKSERHQSFCCCFRCKMSAGCDIYTAMVDPAIRLKAGLQIKNSDAPPN